MAEKIYEYCGEEGGYVPGLPAEISERDAKAEGKWDLLQAAVASGNFRVREMPAPATHKKPVKEN